ncbi:HIT (histidine triad) family protein [mine drainage metagenome]|uniref:HIT (Histidine triad) family protein n=1 Tax=mine drainage metagenome TaxID=410659 RepID=T1AF42_9ZZZZ
MSIKEDDIKDCIFCNLIAGKSNANKVFEDAVAFAFLDRSPVFKGHTLFVPKKHYVNLYELGDDIIERFFSDLRLVAKGVELGTEADGTLIIENNNVSQSVSHLHFHIVPRMYGDGLRGFLWPRRKYKSEDEAKEIAKSINNEIERILHGK